MDARNQATSGVIWSFIERAGLKICSFLVQLVLARILVPEQFGLIALVAVFVTICGAFVDCGFGRALIQKKEILEEDLSTVFYFNILVAFAVVGVLFLSAPYIANFYDQPELELILRVVSLSIVIGAYGGVNDAMFSRSMRFKLLFWVALPSIVISGSVGILLAYMGYGVWALVGQILLQRLIRVSLLRTASDWWPKYQFSFRALKEMFPYGSRLALAGVIDMVFNELYVLVIGKYFSLRDVGYYQRAYVFQQLPVSNIQMVLGRVAFPLFSSMQDDQMRMKRGMRKAISIAGLAAFVCMAGLAAVSRPLVIVLIGEVWLPVVPLLQLLCLVGALYPIHAMNLTLLMSLGRSDLFLKLEVIKKILIILGIFVTFRFGIIVMIGGMIAVSCLSFYLNAFYTNRLIEYSIVEQLVDLRSPFILAIFVFATSGSVAVMLSWNPLVALSASIIAGVCICLFGLRFLASEIKDELKLFVGRFPRVGRVINVLF